MPNENHGRLYSRNRQSRLLTLTFLLFLQLFGNLALGRSMGIRIDGTPETLDWNLAHTNKETYLLMNLMEGLVGLDRDLRVVPKLASNWVVSRDKKTYTFVLKSKLKWSDGSKVTARDFETSWKRLLTPATGASYAYLLYDIQGAREFHEGKITDFSQVGIRALDELTFQVSLVKPREDWIYIPTFWATFPLKEELVQKYGLAWARPGRMLTVGPFALDSIEGDRRYTLKRNPYYHGRSGNLQQVDVWVVPENDRAVTMYREGKIDFVANLWPTDLPENDRLQKELKSYPYLKVDYLGFTVSKFPASDLNVRRAIALALDRNQLATMLSKGHEVASSFVPPPLKGFDRKIGIKMDLKAAKKELSLAGYDSIRRIKLDVVTSNSERSQKIAQWIQKELRVKLGADVSLQVFDYRSFRTQLDFGAFHLFDGVWGADFPSAVNFLETFTSTSGNNRTQWKNNNYDRLVQEGKIMEAQKLLLEKEVVVIPLFYEPNSVLVKPRVRGLVLNPINYLFLGDVNVQ